MSRCRCIGSPRAGGARAWRILTRPLHRPLTRPVTLTLTLTQARLLERAELEHGAALAHLHRVAVGRLTKLQLSKGWNAWAEVHEAQARSRKLRQRALSKMRKPGMAGAFGFWQHDWERRAREQQTAALRQQLQGEAAARAGLEAELERTRNDADSALSATRSMTTSELEQLKRRHAAELESALAAAVAAAKEAHVRHIQQLAIRRLSQQGLSRGFNAWREGHEQSARQMSALRRGASTLLKPRVVRAFGYWLRSWSDEASERTLHLWEEAAAKKAEARDAEVRRLEGALAEAKERLTQEKQRRQATEREVLTVARALSPLPSPRQPMGAVALMILDDSLTALRTAPSRLRWLACARSSRVWAQRQCGARFSTRASSRASCREFERSRRARRSSAQSSTCSGWLSVGSARRSPL